MTNPNPDTTTACPARTHADSADLLRRPFAPGAIGFRAMTKVTLGGVQYAGAQVAAFLNAQSVVQRLNHVVPGRWRQQFTPVAGELAPANSKTALPLVPADHHPPRTARRARRRRGVRGHRRDGRGSPPSQYNAGSSSRSRQAWTGRSSATSTSKTE
jgi:hypothetical protein